MAKLRQLVVFEPISLCPASTTSQFFLIKSQQGGGSFIFQLAYNLVYMFAINFHKLSPNPINKFSGCSLFLLQKAMFLSLKLLCLQKHQELWRFWYLALLSSQQIICRSFTGANRRKTSVSETEDFITVITIARMPALFFLHWFIQPNSRRITWRTRWPIIILQENNWNNLLWVVSMPTLHFRGRYQLYYIRQ